MAIPSVRILSAMGFADGASNEQYAACPLCGGKDSFVFRDDHCGGVVAHCGAYGCPWIGDAFQFYMDTNKIEDPAAAIAALRAAKVKIPKACDRHQTIRAYKKHIESYKALQTFYGHMEKRSLKSLYGQPMNALGYAIQPHVHAEWWCTTALELKHHLSGHVVSDGGHGWASIKNIAGSDEAPVLAIPHYDSAERVVGLAVVGELHCGWYYGHGMPLGVALGGTSSRKYPPAWNDKWVVTTSIDVAVAVSAAAKRDHDMLYPLCLTTDPGTQDVRATLRSRVGARSYVVWPGHHIGAVNAPDILLARRLGAPIAVGHPTGKQANNNPVQWVAQNVISAAVPWLEALETAALARSDWAARTLVSDVGWCPKVAAKAKQLWKPANYDRVDALMNTTAWRDIYISADLVVTETPDGLVNTINGQLLYEALPRVESVYRGDDGRTRYAGKVTLQGADYAFDSATFNKDPVAVIDAVLLRAGRAAPAPHPAVVPHLVSIARYRVRGD